jgi:chromate transporter
METETTAAKQTRAAVRGRFLEVFLAFLKLGLMSFGGPIAHLGYFRDEFVTRRRWLDEHAFAELVGLCQFSPGPASSKVGFALGVLRGGYPGGFAAWLGFTTPSALALIVFAYGADIFHGAAGAGVLHGLKVVAVAVIAQAVWGMARNLCPDRPRAGIAVGAVVIVIFAASGSGQIAAIVAGALAGLWLCRGGAAPSADHLAVPISRAVGVGTLVAFFAFLVLLPAAARAVPGSHTLALIDAFYRAGALVFGGGHVVLPLLQAAVVQPGWLGNDAFLAGYGAAQAVPGPLFTFAAYLGTVMGPNPNGWTGALICLVAIFVPGLLLVLGTVPFWNALRRRPLAQAAMRGTNAAVVGILLAALYDPVWTSAVRVPRDFALALIAFCLLTVWRAAPWIVVLVSAAGGATLALL